MNVADARPQMITVDLALIDEAEDNPNVMDPIDFLQLVDAIRSGGCLQPILVTQSVTPGRFLLVDGHHRVKAMREVGLTETDAVVGDMTLDDAKAQRIAMNKLRGSLDLAKVSQTLLELQSKGWDIAELTTTGFSEEEIQDLITSASQSDEDVMQGSSPQVEPEEAPNLKGTGGFVLEVAFETADALRLAKRKLRKVAGKGQPLWAGLMRALGEEEI